MIGILSDTSLISFYLSHIVMYYFCTFIPIISSCLAAPKARVRLSIIYFNLGCFVFVTMMSRISIEVVWYFLIGFVFYAAGGFTAILYVKNYEKVPLFIFSKTSWGFFLFSLTWIISDFVIVIVSPESYLEAYPYSGTLAMSVSLLYFVIVGIIINYKKKKKSIVTSN